MRKLFLLIVTFLTLISCAQAQLMGISDGKTIGMDDGIANAPVYNNNLLSILHSDFFTSYALQSGQTPYVVTHTWNAAGVDYPVGIIPARYCNGTTIPCSTTPGAENLIDPTQYNWTTDPAKTGCVNASYTASLNYVYCAPKGNVNFVGFDMSINNCVGLIIQNAAVTTGGTINISNNYFKMGTSQWCSVVKAPYPANVNLSTDQVWDVVFNNNRLDGGADNVSVRPAQLVTQQNAYFHVLAGGNFIAKYNAITNIIGRVFNIGTCGDQIIAFNYQEGFGYWPEAVHAEMALQANNTGCAPQQIYVNNTLLQPANLAHPATTSLISSGEVAAAHWRNGVFKWNTMVVNRESRGGMGATKVNGSQTGIYYAGDILSVVNGTCSSPGTVLVTAVSGGAITTLIAWDVGNCADGTTGTFSTAPLSCPNAPNAVCAGSGATVSTAYSTISAGYALQMGLGAYDTLTISNNLTDYSGAFYEIFYQQTKCTMPPVIINNYNLSTGSLAKVEASGQVGCQ